MSDISIPRTGSHKDLGLISFVRRLNITDLSLLVITKCRVHFFPVIQPLRIQWLNCITGPIAIILLYSNMMSTFDGGYTEH